MFNSTKVFTILLLTLAIDFRNVRSVSELVHFLWNQNLFPLYSLRTDRWYCSIKSLWSSSAAPSHRWNSMWKWCDGLVSASIRLYKIPTLWSRPYFHHGMFCWYRLQRNQPNMRLAVECGLCYTTIEPKHTGTAYKFTDRWGGAVPWWRFDKYSR